VDQPLPPRHRSFVGPIILIVLGVLILLFNLYPDFNPWPVFFRYWPLILILIGLGKIWDSYYWRHHTGQQGASPWISGTGTAWILLLVFFIVASWHRGGWRQYDDGWNRPWNWHGRALADEAHDTQAVELQGAKSVDMDLNIPAGQLSLGGGSSHLMEGDFHYDRHRDKPNVEYSVSEDRGQLHVGQDGNDWHTHWGNDDNEWDMKVANNVPIDLRLEMGAGQSNLRLNGVEVKNLDIHMGAGQLDLDLTGPRSTSMTGTIEGGVGQATVRLPKDVGVRVEASGGIGSVDSRDLKRDGDAYVNDSYGKTPTSIELTIHGGIGEIRLIQE
jgi:predicted membrane protein